MMGTLDHLERLAHVDELLVALVLRASAELGGRWRVLRGATTDEEQARLYAKGRTIPGEDVTPTRPMGRTVTESQTAEETAHGIRMNGACAVDLAALYEDGSVDWMPTRYEALGIYVKARGFQWGGDFKIVRAGKLLPFFDGGHVQLPGWRTIPLIRPTPTKGTP